MLKTDANESNPGELELLRAERDALLRLLELGESPSPQEFVHGALELAVMSSGAMKGYVQIADPDEVHTWSAHSGFSPDASDRVRGVISRGVIAEALATRQTIVSADAAGDERFSMRESVRSARIEAVICAPIFGPTVEGALYLQGRREGGAFSMGERDFVASLASRLSRFAELVLHHERMQAKTDSVAPLRKRADLEGIVGHSAVLASVLDQVLMAARTDATVLLTGPSGTGKSALVDVIHRNSRRAAGPLIEVNCGALPDSLIENELFGAMAGAHNQADRNRAGKVDAAKGGTLFLDEIGELSRSVQSSLLQLVQSRTYFPLGASQPHKVDVRIVAASNADLERAVQEGRFRQDLYYRLCVLPVVVPSLSERKEDIVPLAQHFAARFAERHGLEAKSISPQALVALEASDWIGNVRQLENTVEAGIIRAAGTGYEQVDTHHLFPSLKFSSSEAPPSLQDATRSFQRQYLISTLEETEWNVSEAARRLGVARSHVYRLIQALQVTRD